MSKSSSGDGAAIAEGGIKKNVPGHDDAIQEPERSKIKLVLCFGVFMVIPGAILFIVGLTEHARCEDVLDDCLDRCTEIYKYREEYGNVATNYEFQSEFSGLRTCENICRDEKVDCENRGMSVAYGGVTLGFGLCCGSIIVVIMDCLSQRVGASTVMDAKRPRPAYAEPNYTEEEKRKQKNSLSWKKQPAEVHVVEARCMDCDVEAYVDHRWRTCERGGAEGAICPRCKKIILGVL